MFAPQHLTEPSDITAQPCVYPAVAFTAVTGATAEAFCAGLTETATEMAISRNKEQMHDSFLIEKFYTKCRISLEAFAGHIRPGLPTWLEYRAP